jgi:chemotaxis family two-component system sensor kinase Cph1
VRLSADSLHDLIGPINHIGTISELLRKKYDGALDKDAEALFGFLQSAAGRLQSLADGMRTYMRIAGAPSGWRLCDANAILAEAKASIQPEIDQNSAVVSHDPLPELYCDPRQIGYALASLIENAIKFRCEIRPEVHISAAGEENHWKFSVKDNGFGIDSRYGERIFGMFKRLHTGSRPGVGAGLAITRQVVEQHGGRIWVESEPGCGATFYFTLPQRG